MGGTSASIEGTPASLTAPTNIDRLYSVSLDDRSPIHVGFPPGLVSRFEFLEELDRRALRASAMNDRRDALPERRVQPHGSKTRKRPRPGLDAKCVPPLVQQRLVSDGYLFRG